MTTVHEILAGKPQRLVSVSPEATVLDAVRIMADAHVGALPVLDKGQLVGILSERDYARKVILLGRASGSTPVREIMSHPVITVGLRHRAGDCMREMTERRIRHLPVLDGDDVVGMISIGDLVKAVIDEQRQEIDQLQRYISS